MSTVLNFKDIIDLPKWRDLATPLGIGRSGQAALVSDPRNNEDRHPFIFISSTNTENNERIIAHEAHIIIKNSFKPLSSRSISFI